MVSQALIDWVRRQEVKGYNSQQIYLYLVNNGYDQRDVIEAINISNSSYGTYPRMMMQSPQYSQQPQPEVKKHNSHIGLKIFLIILVLLGGAGYYVYEYQKPLYESVLSMVYPQAAGNANTDNTDAESIDTVMDNSDATTTGIPADTDSSIVVENPDGSESVDDSSFVVEQPSDVGDDAIADYEAVDSSDDNSVQDPDNTDLEYEVPQEESQDIDGDGIPDY